MTHPSIGGPTPARDLAARIAGLEAEHAHLRAASRRDAEEMRWLANENLTLLHRARVGEDRLASVSADAGDIRLSPDHAATAALT